LTANQLIEANAAYSGRVSNRLVNLW
jgi:hypothetical protein